MDLLISTLHNICHMQISLHHVKILYVKSLMTIKCNISTQFFH